MHRLFIALVPPAPVRTYLTGLMAGVPGARWQRDDQLHLTLRFIGPVDRHQAEEIAIALSALRHAPLTLALNGVGQFAHRGRPHALWAGVHPQTELVALHHKLDQLLIRCGLAPERRAYLPHIALARFGAGGGTTEPFLRAHAALAGPSFTLDALHLFESVLGHAGATYAVIERYPFRA